jgi:hypothetical protein
LQNIVPLGCHEILQIKVKDTTCQKLVDKILFRGEATVFLFVGSQKPWGDKNKIPIYVIVGL